MAKKPEPEPLAEQVRQAMLSSGLTRYRVAQKTGLPQSTLSRLARGAVPSLETTERIARALGYQVLLKKCRRAKGTRREGS